jgi:replicative DNA helicase
VDELTDYIAHLTEKYDTGAVLIDYIQKVKSKRTYQSRQLEIQDISRQLLETSLACSVPIVLGAQVNREVKGIEGLTLDTLREAGDIEQDANLVLGLWNKTQNKEDLERDRQSVYHDRSPAQATDSVVDLDVMVMKNRDGVTNQKAALSFDRPVLKLKDKENPY